MLKTLIVIVLIVYYSSYRMDKTSYCKKNTYISGEIARGEISQLLYRKIFMFSGRKDSGLQVPGRQSADPGRN